jgi:hypothetical protein
MDELDSLARALREELGGPPEAWKAAQRARVREGLREPARRASWRGPALWVGAALAVAAAIVWVTVGRTPKADLERWLVAEELAAPVRLDDGSSISLSAGGRGRLFADAATVRFDLHGGRASFDVVPARKRTWTISAGGNEVRVVGTRFSVLYGPGEEFEVDVERGVVAVKVPERNASIELEAGDHLRGHPGRVEVVHRAVKPAPSTPVPEPSAHAPVVEAPAAASSATALPGSSSTASADWQARYAEGKYAEALALVRASGVGQRLHELPPRKLAELADVARLGGDPELAVAALTALLRRFPNAPEARDGSFLLGRVHALRGDGAAAVDAFERYLAGGAASRYTNEALGRLMELYSKRGNREKARGVAERYLARAPNGPYGRLARSLLE